MNLPRGPLSSTIPGRRIAARKAPLRWGQLTTRSARRTLHAQAPSSSRQGPAQSLSVAATGERHQGVQSVSERRVPKRPEAATRRPDRAHAALHGGAKRARWDQSGRTFPVRMLELQRSRTTARRRQRRVRRRQRRVRRWQRRVRRVASGRAWIARCTDPFTARRQEPQGSERASPTSSSRRHSATDELDNSHRR
jgi:hypothetical protein